MTEENVVAIETIQTYGVKMPDGTVKAFATLELAQAEVTRQRVEVEVMKYTAARGLSSKVAKTRCNVIIDYLSWIEAGCPEAPPAPEGEEEEVPADEEFEADEAPIED